MIAIGEVIWERPAANSRKNLGGVIFAVFVVIVGKRKFIYNLDIIPAIRKEIERLKRT
jgi:hypothetical protein